MLEHRYGKSNKVVDALSQRTMMLNTMFIELVSLNYVKTLYEEDADFSEAWKALKSLGVWIAHHIWIIISKRSFFLNQQLCISRSSIRMDLIKELHSGVLGGVFGYDKTIALVKEIYFWPIMNKYVRKFVEGCRVKVRT